MPRVSGPSEAPQNSEVAENVTSSPLKPISLSNIQPVSTSSVNDTSQHLERKVSLEFLIKLLVQLKSNLHQSHH